MKMYFLFVQSNKSFVKTETDLLAWHLFYNNNGMEKKW